MRTQQGSKGLHRTRGMCDLAKHSVAGFGSVQWARNRTAGQGLELHSQSRLLWLGAGLYTSQYDSSLKAENGQD